MTLNSCHLPSDLGVTELMSPYINEEEERADRNVFASLFLPARPTSRAFFVSRGARRLVATDAFSRPWPVDRL